MEREDMFTTQGYFAGLSDKINGFSGAEAYAAMIAGFKVKRHASAGYWRIDVDTGKLTFGDASGNETTDGDPSLVAMNMAAHDWEILL